jgi:glutamate/aspartate transport system substrate-binding protein
MKRLAILFALLALSNAPAWAQGGVLAKIKKTGTITMGYVDNAAPFSFVDGNRQPQGYSVELCRRIASGIRSQLGLANLETKWVALTVQNRLAAVRDGKVDIECGTVTWTLSRQKDVDFSLITFVDGASILTRIDGNLNRLADLSGKRIAVISGTTTEKILKAALEKRAIKADVVLIKQRDEGLQRLDKGEVDGFASDRMVLIGITLKSKTKTTSFKLLDEDFSVEPYALPLPRGDHDYRLAVNRVLAGLYRTGEIEKIYDQWLGPFGRPSLLLSAAFYIQGLAE